MKPDKLYHGSYKKIEGALNPILTKDSPDHIHNKPAVFAVDRIDVASLFMSSPKNILSIGFEQDIAYICIWGNEEEFASHDAGGYIYILSPESFEKVGKDYEWQSFVSVSPIEVKFFPAIVSGMMECGVQVYFINDEKIFDKIVENKNDRSGLLKTLISQNQKQKINIKTFV